MGSHGGLGGGGHRVMMVKARRAMMWARWGRAVGQLGESTGGGERSP